jgi:hypothetical protein
MKLMSDIQRHITAFGAESSTNRSTQKAEVGGQCQNGTHIFNMNQSQHVLSYVQW